MGMQACCNCKRDISTAIALKDKCPLCGHPDPLHKQRNLNLFMIVVVIGVSYYFAPDVINGIFSNLYHQLFK